MQGFGLFAYIDSKPYIERSATEEGILQWFVKQDSPFIMFHHRFPTSTVNVAEAAHPMTTGKYFGDHEYVLVHNGVITNDEELYTKHAKLGINYTTLLNDLTFNDSECLLWEFALMMEGKQTEMDVRGDLAFVCVRLVKGKVDNVYYGRHGRPLHMVFDKKSFELSSEGKGGDIPIDRLYTYNIISNKISKKRMVLAKPRIYPSYTYTPTTHTNPHSPSWDDYMDDDEFDAQQRYDDFWYNRDRLAKEPNILERTLREHFSKKSAPNKYIEGEVIDASALDEDYVNKIAPTQQQILQRAMLALDNHMGVFEEAYYEIEAEYSDTFEDYETTGTIKHRLLLEAVMEFFAKDPEYVSEHSVSSTWRSVCSQQKLIPSALQ